MPFLLTSAWKRRQKGGLWRVGLCPLSLLLFVIGTGSLAAAQTGTPWLDADKLFHSDPRWLGADGAYSVDLGNGRVLWIFSDTFVARKAGDDRRHAAFVHNTVAIQSGYDPSQATIKFYWRTRRGEPSEVFASEGRAWMWPSAGIRIGNRLLLFSGRIASDTAKDSLGFKLLGWNAYWVSNPDDEPSAWKLKAAAESSDSVIMASAVLRDGGFVYFFGESEPEHDLYVVRLAVETLARGKFGPLEWWSGGGWQTAPSGRRPIQLAVGTETSVQRDPSATGFLEINSRGFGASDIVMRRAENLEGPWSASTMIYRPPESDAPDAFVYAGKSHAELKGADLILTYAANGPDEKVAKDMSLYFPRFVKVDLHPRQHTQ
ncbi:MAG TPA: DUF4185 domain-containing protein [Terracidiphilus sp.]|nr:DUF4185 domain-containing protein [Terracidiphilus sp.]